jgi:coenzyme F420-reducing hydrogenase alpha subunit
MPSMSDEREIAVDYLARVEGEGAMYLKLVGDEVADLRFKIFEPPRFIEALLRGRHSSEAPDITARICGICPIAYQTSASNAVEQAAGVDVGPELLRLRRLVYLGEWIESHVLHIFFLHAPDFLGYPSGIEMARDFPDQVKTALRLKKLGNSLVTLLGGREIHPVGLRVGGFYRVPAVGELKAITGELEWGLEAAVEAVAFVAGLPFPDFERDYEFVALRHPDEYAIASGRIVSNRGLDIAPEEWPDHFVESQVEWSNALHARRRDGDAYFVGPLARYSLNSGQLTPRASRAAAEAGLGKTCTNPFRSIVVRAVEVVLAAEEALRIVDEYEPPPRPFIEADPRGATGHGVSEAPRGLLYHRYDVDGTGHISDAHIVPPTSQNQLSIEDDLRAYATRHARLADDELTGQLEQAIRNYDPCISCATHFLDLHVDRHP